jgi:excisionase family DNA binding protein
MKLMIENRLLNKRELSEYMGVSMGKVELMMSDGLKYIKMNRNVRFRMDDINDYLNQRVVV